MPSINYPKKDFLPNLLISVGILYIIFLLQNIPNNAFYSGDAGIKALVVKQFSNGIFDVGLHLDRPTWVDRVWGNGFFPFAAPFIYDVQSKKVVSFPFLFQALSAPFYKIFGVKGLYVLPSISVILCWVYLKKILKSHNFNAIIISLAIFIFIFPSPLTLYSSIYWEHSLAVLFSMIGLECLSKTRHKKYSIVKGFIFGLSVWLRPEAIVFCGLILLALLVKKSRKNHLTFIGCTSLTIFSFFIVNELVYGHFLGVHSFQVISSYENKLTQALSYFKTDIYLLGRYFPLCIVCIALLFHWPLRYSSTSISIATILFIIIIPFFIPNHGGKQWGPRYLLLTIPCFTYLIAVTIQTSPPKVKKALVVLILFLGLYGTYWNTYIGYKYLKNDYSNRVIPGVEALLSYDENIVVVTNQLVAQEFTQIFNQKYFFLAESQEDLTRLISLLKDEKKYSFIFATINPEIPLNGSEKIETVSKPIKKGAYSFGKYKIIQ